MTNKKINQRRTANAANSPLRDRVNQSLRKLGYAEAHFVEVKDETVNLHCPVSDRNDRCMISVAIRLLPGVSAVEFVSIAGTSE